MLLIVIAQRGHLSADDGPVSSPKPPVAQLADVVALDEPRLTECSGLAWSRRRVDRFWAHNDSGGRPAVYAFDTSGRRTGLMTIPVKAIDWEDMASYVEDGTARLLIADCGDNGSRRASITIYLLDEPDPDESTVVTDFQTIEVTYPDGPCNCEAVAVDLVRKRVFLLSKTLLPMATLYVIDLPSRSTQSTTQRVVARKVRRLVMPVVTAMDIDPDNGDLWVTSYVQTLHFRCADRSQPMRSQLDERPTEYRLPRWKQVEAICVDNAGRAWVSSEGASAPMGRLVIERGGVENDDGEPDDPSTNHLRN